MEQYNLYKDSGEVWQGEVPEQWQLTKLKYLVSLNGNNAVEDNDFSPANGNDFKVALENIESNTGRYIATNEEQAFEGVGNIFKTGDVLFNKLRPYLAKVYLAEQNGISVGELLVLTPGKHLTSKFLYYCLISPSFIEIVNSSTYGSKMPRANWDFIGNLNIAVPSIFEQARITHFLNYQTGLIDMIVSKKQRLIKSLKEYRQSVINEAVIKGLNPHVTMKDSGVEWLEEVPEHWQVLPLRYLNNKVGSGVTPKGGAEVYTEEGIIFIRSQNVHFDGLRLDEVARIDISTHEEMSNSKVQYNDVLLNITGASIGRCCVVDVEEEMNVNQHVCIIRPKQDKVISNYLNLVLASSIGQAQVRMELTGGNRDGLTVEAIKAFLIPLPETTEQEEIVTHVNGFLSQAQVVEHKILTQIEKLKEYRQSLISEAVTGKIDLRDWEPARDKQKA